MAAHRNGGRVHEPVEMHACVVVVQMFDVLPTLPIPTRRGEWVNIGFCVEWGGVDRVVSEGGWGRVMVIGGRVEIVTGQGVRCSVHWL